GMARPGYSLGLLRPPHAGGAGTPILALRVLEVAHVAPLSRYPAPAPGHSTPVCARLARSGRPQPALGARRVAAGSRGGIIRTALTGGCGPKSAAPAATQPAGWHAPCDDDDAPELGQRLSVEPADIVGQYSTHT